MDPVVLDLVSHMHFEDYNPEHVRRAVNLLQPLGKDEALDRIDSYLENRDGGRDAYGLFWVLRVLFEVPEERGFPPVRIGQPTIPPPDEPEKLPRFPIVIIREIPFLVVRGYSLGGLPELVKAHVEYFRAHGILRDRPLLPSDSTQGVEQQFRQLWETAYGHAYEAEALKAIRAQITRLSSRPRSDDTESA